ncbi:FAD-dependent monooxygenase [Leptolyngbya sp. NIES-2104]|uniref:FAD-dependent monooxygenase n=1 Tax=Leptolyngbya sp. NIES-2104 TaxID=1552121 RepID=UPI0006EC5B14|nr:FAD-dependent monooxygenase [Leptolyngbya sp. NIES-2104]GAP94245.1 2-polyprenyl-6-methoxyphenol hydroxylase and related FAD-dependent oxidoreductase [Leptolyngbya sp. NIES-2104]
MNIVIVGAGIGGLATANALLKQRFNVQVYEQAQALRAIGAGLTLTPNGLNSLNAVQPGIVESLIKAGSLAQMLMIRQSTGETIASKPVTTLQQYGQPLLNIQWSKLQAILANALPPDIIHLQHRCVGFQQQNNSIEVFFADGETVQADLLIGADGVNSVVRQGLIGDGAPTYAGRMSWRAVIQYAHEQLPPDTGTIMTADGKIIVLTDVGQGYTFWSAGVLQEDDSVCDRASDVKARVLELFAGWGEPVEAIIKATPDESIVERPICDRSPVERWSKGRVTLMGDAAHPVVPSLGQGANTAFEDAYELAQCLSVAPNIEAALQTYEASRIPRTTAIYDRSASQGRKSYQAASERTFAELMGTSEMSQDDFEAWLYSYNPATLD